MKQRIDTSDLQQLTPLQQDKLRELWIPEIGDVIDYMGNTQVITDPNGGTYLLSCGILDSEAKCDFHRIDQCLPIFSIGQCIQLLESYDRCINMTNAIFGVEYDNKFTWEVRLRHLDTLNYQPELIDALFQTIKEIL